MDNLFTSVKFVKHLKEMAIWCVGTIRANRLAGAAQLLKSKKELEKEGRGSMDYRCDANSNIVILRWLDNGLVQLVSAHSGIDVGDDVQRWSGKDKKVIEVPCPNVVHDYNKHMGGVDLCDMMMSLYRIRICTKKWYMHLVYYCIGVSVVNAWLLYRRHSKQNQLPKKELLNLKDFQYRIATALLQSGKTTAKTRGRPSLIQLPEKKKTTAASAIPATEIRHDRVGHFPVFTGKVQKRCRFCRQGYSRIMCSKCNVQLCLVTDRNCFYDFHHK